MEKEEQKHHHRNQELLQLLPPPTQPALFHRSSSSNPTQWNFTEQPSTSSKNHRFSSSNKPYSHRRRREPSLDLQLSINLQPSSSDCILMGDSPIKQRPPKLMPPSPRYDVEALKWQAAEQIRLASMERAYAEQVSEMTRKEMELAQAEFARARILWERAREEVARVERLKERSTRQIDNSCMEITCHSCRQRFRA